MINSGALAYCSSLAEFNIPSAVTSIDAMAFRGCASLKEITIGKAVESIGSRAFVDCTSLKKVTIDSEAIASKRVFNGMNNLFGDQVEQIIFGDNVQNVGVFNRFPNLRSVYIPASVESIYHSAFKDCPSLKTVTLDCNAFLSKNFFNVRDVDQIPGIFGEQVENYIIGSNVEEIGPYAFYGCKNIVTLSIDDTSSSEARTRSNSSKGLKTIGDRAFGSCSNMESVKIPNTVTTLGDQVFEGCSALTEVTVPASVAEVGQNVFADCPKLTSVGISEGATEITAQQFKAFSGLTTVTIPSTVTRLSADALASCSSLTDVYFLPNAVDLTWDSKSAGLKSGLTVHTPLDQFSPYINKFYYSGGAKFAGELSTLSAGEDIEERFATFHCSNLNVKVTDESAKVYAAIVEGEVLKLTEIATHIAYKKTNGGGYILSSVEQTIPVITDEGSGSSSLGNDLNGTDEQKTLSELLNLHSNANAIFVLRYGDNGLGFYRLNAGERVGAGQAYLAAGSSLSHVGMLYLDNGNPALLDVPTIFRDDFEIADSWYTLDGRKLSEKPTRQGLYIQNRQKHIIK